MIKLVNETELAEMLSVSVRKLQKDRARGVGIPFVRIGRAVRYPLVEVERFVETECIRPGSQPHAR